MRKLLSFAAATAVLASVFTASLPVSAAGNGIPSAYEVGKGTGPDTKATVKLSGDGLQYTSACTPSGTGRMDDETMMVFSDPVELNQLKVTYTIDDDPLSLIVPDVDHWFCFSFINSKRVFPQNFARDPAFTEADQGFSIRIRPSPTGLSFFVDRFVKGRGFLAEALALPIDYANLPILKSQHCFTLKVDGSDIYVNVEDQKNAGGELTWHKLVNGAKYFPSGKAYFGLTSANNVDSSGKPVPMTFSIRKMSYGDSSPGSRPPESTPATKAPSSQPPSSSQTPGASSEPGPSKTESADPSSSPSNTSSSGSSDPVVSTGADKDDPGGPNVGLIVGIVAAAAVVLGGAGVGGYFFIKKRKGQTPAE